MAVTIRTERLRLREYTEDDVPALHDLLSDPVTMSRWPAPFTYEQTEAWVRRQTVAYPERLGRYAVTLAETGELIGDAGLMRAEINGRLEMDLGYIISCRHWRRGYGLEAAKAVMARGFADLKLERICANMAVDHDRSRQVAERLGMTLETYFHNPRNRNLLTCLYVKRKDSDAVQAGEPRAFEE